MFLNLFLISRVLFFFSQEYFFSQNTYFVVKDYSIKTDSTIRPTLCSSRPIRRLRIFCVLNDNKNFDNNINEKFIFKIIFCLLQPRNSLLIFFKTNFFIIINKRSGSV